ncbi:MAG: FapA family protein [Spirochaetes bacterium]|nr:FapA family protein [Spirochaetota bacterium]
MPSKKFVLKGTITILTRNNYLEGVLQFKPGTEAIQLDVQDLMALLFENGIKEGISPQSLEKILKQLEKATQSEEYVVAKGIPPQNPQPEKPVWQNLPIPEPLQKDAQTALSIAGVPVITQEKVERVKVEKVVEKKPSLPFLPPKKETVTAFEKKVVQERVYVDPKVLGVGYVKAGEKVALIEPMQEGIPGKGVNGATIPFEPLIEPYVYAGRGIEKKNGELIAQQTGFVRWGKNWAEIIPFQSHTWEVTLSNDKATCYLNFTPGNREATLPSPEEILSAAEKLPYPRELLIPSDEMDALLRQILSFGKPVQNIPISQSADAKAEIRVTEDKLKAFLYLRKGRGKGKPLSLKEIGTLIKNSNLKGLNFEKIKTDILAFYQGPSIELTDYLLCEGKPPTQGPDRKFEWSVQFFEPKKWEELKKAALHRPQALSAIPSISAFPLEMVQEAGPVVKDQRVLVLSPMIPGQPGIDVYGNSIPGIPGKDPSLILYENLEKKQNVIIASVDGILEKRTTEEGIYLRVRPHKDGEVKVTLSPNRMEAFLTLMPSEGTGKPITAEWVREAIEQSGIVKGLREDLILDALERVQKGKPVVELPIAFGQLPQEGGANQIKFLIKLASQEKVTIRSDGSADYKNRDLITTVKAGDLIAEVLPPDTPPQDGWDVTGKPIPAKAPTPFNLEIGPGIRTEERDGKNILIAETSGELLYDKKRILIQESHIIKGNIDLSTGNVKFPGSVVISGSVLSGFYVMAQGDIKIGEGVEAALLSADGSIYVQQGVKGAGKAVLRTKKNVYASFLEQTIVLAVGDVKVKNACLRCTIKSNGKVELISDKGFLIGGTVKARYGVSAAGLGTDKGVHTEISFGQDYLVADQIELAEKEMKKLNEAKTRLDTLIHQCEKSGDRKNLDHYRKEKLKTLKLIESLSLKLFTLREKFEEHFPSQIVVRGTVYPGVVIESHGRYHEFTTPKKNIKIQFDQSTGRITESPLE